MDGAGDSRIKARAAALSICSNVALTTAKTLAAVFSGSISVLSEAAHSAGDIVASLVAYASVRVSDRPADEEHPFGHGKVESIAGLVEAVLLLVAAMWVAIEAIARIANPEPIAVDIALAVVAGAAVVNVFVGRYLKNAAERTDSDALRADAAHITADILTSVGVLAALILVQVTGSTLWDPAIALLLSVWILFTASRIAIRAFDVLIDRGLPPDEVAAIENIFNDNEQVIDWHQLRTRKSGSYRHVDAHILLRDELSLIEAHEITERVEDEIRAALPNVSISLHMEPYRQEVAHRRKMHKKPG
jgi:cation diffusion facilitator family transporter